MGALVVWAIVAGATAAPAGAITPARPAGSLVVTVSGLPTGVAPVAGVRGARAFWRRIPARGLRVRHARPGVYRIAASPVRVRGAVSVTTYRPRHAVIRVRVRPHRRSTVRLAYRGTRDSGGMSTTAGTSELPSAGNGAPQQLPSAGRTIALGNEHGCLRRRSGAVACWGSNRYGEVGNGTTTPSPSPVTVTGVSDAVEVAAGASFSCARRVGGSVVCWGDNRVRQLGTGQAGNSSEPVPVAGVTDAVSLSAAGEGACVARASGAVACWGHYLIDQNTIPVTQLTPTPVPGISGAVEVSGGGQSMCARLASGTLACWGDNAFGNLGDGTRLDRFDAAVPVKNVAGAVHVSASGDNTCALLSSAGVDCWGGDGYGESSGMPSRDLYRLDPGPVSGVSEVAQVAAAGGSTCVLYHSGTAACWGLNNGALGDGTITDRPTPAPVPGVTDGVELAAANVRGCVRQRSGHVLCWGFNGQGQLGDGTQTTRLTPVPLPGITDAG